MGRYRTVVSTGILLNLKRFCFAAPTAGGHWSSFLFDRLAVFGALSAPMHRLSGLYLVLSECGRYSILAVGKRECLGDNRGHLSSMHETRRRLPSLNTRGLL